MARPEAAFVAGVAVEGSPRADGVLTLLTFGRADAGVGVGREPPWRISDASIAARIRAEPRGATGGPKRAQERRDRRWMVVDVNDRRYDQRGGRGDPVGGGRRSGLRYTPANNGEA
jgi:hypothetical protein